MRSLSALRILACVALAVSACSERGSTGASGDAGGTVVFAIGGQEPTPLLPPLAADVISRIVTDNVFDRLAEIGPELNTLGDRGFQPRLARSWTWAKDSLSIAFSLDPRARWHDGQPVRASDVKFSFDVSKDPKTATQVTASIANVDSVNVRDSATVVIWYHRRTPEQFYDFVYQVPILPEHVLNNVARDQLGTSDVVRRPIGTGRFRFGRWEPGVRIELLADTANYRGRPKLDRFIVSFAADAGAAITQLLSGQSDFFDNLPPPVIPRIDSASQLRTVRYPGLGYAQMGMNLRDPKRPAAPHPVFGDRRVRLAISMALDRQAMLRNVFDTLGILGVGPYPRTLADTTVKPPPFDRARASALLDSAGWHAGSGGVRAKNGRPLAFSIIVPTSSTPRQAYAVLIQEQLKSIGANVEIERVDISTFIERTSQSRNFDAAMLTTATDPSPAGIKQNWGTEGIGKGLQNQLSYSNPRFDALVDSATKTFDPDRATRYYHQAYQTLVDDAPSVWLYDLLTIAGVHKRVRPVGMRADEWWANLADWWIPANERIDRDRIGLRAARQ